jgi:hypothetical protein
MTDDSGPAFVWRKSSFCNTGACVEVAQHGQRYLVRKNSRVLIFDAEEWETFLAGVKAGEFDPESSGTQT